jgi:hypothetical protein
MALGKLVTLECEHTTQTTDRTQPIALGELRWCESCKEWKRITSILNGFECGHAS